jgi:hypothetical protein
MDIDFLLNKEIGVLNLYHLWVDSRFNGANLLVVSSELTWSSAVSDSSLILLYWLSVPVKPWFCKKCLSQRVLLQRLCTINSKIFTFAKKRMSKGIVKKLLLSTSATVQTKIKIEN